MSPRSLVLTVALAAAVTMLGSAGQLPDRVASHFGISGRADGMVSVGRWTGQPKASAKISVPVIILKCGMKSSSSHATRSRWR